MMKDDSRKRLSGTWRKCNLSNMILPVDGTNLPHSSDYNAFREYVTTVLLQLWEDIMEILETGIEDGAL